MTDSEILDLYWNRDEEAIHKTQERYGGKLQRLSMGILDDPSDAQECVNDTYLQAWNTIPPKRPDHFFAYLAKICRYISFGRLDYGNATKRKAQVVSLTAEMEQCIPDCRAGQALEAEELGALLTAFLKTQSMDARRIFLRRYFHMESVSEIAKGLGFSESKVKSVLFRTRNKLYDYLQKEGDAPVNGKDLLDAMNFVEDGLVTESEKRQNRLPLQWLATAACLCILAGSLFLLQNLRPDNVESMHPECSTTIPKTETNALPHGMVLLRVETPGAGGFLATVLDGGDTLTAGSRVTVTMEAGNLDNTDDIPACRPGDVVQVKMIRYDAETKTVYAECVTQEETP